MPQAFEFNARSEQAVRVLLDRQVHEGNLPGASVLIRQRGRDVLYHASGLSDLESKNPLQRDTLVRLFSVTKPIMTDAFMVLVDQNKVSLNDPMSRYLPELAQLTVDGSADRVSPQAITMRNLLTHTAGFSYWFQPVPVARRYDEELGAAGPLDPWRFEPKYGGMQGFLEGLAKIPLVFTPGERFHYSMALDVAGAVVERVTGVRLDQWMRDCLFRPLNMHDTLFAVPSGKADRLASMYKLGDDGSFKLVESGSESPLLGKVSAYSGGGGLVSTLDDYGRFGEMLLKGGEYQGHRVLSVSAVKQILSNQLDPSQLEELPETSVTGLGGDGKGLGFGLGGAVVTNAAKNDEPICDGEYSWGGGASSSFWVDPANELTAVLMTQLTPVSKQRLRDKLHVAVYV